MVLLLLVCNMIILPVTITFFREDLSTLMIMFNVVSDICFMIDICLNFRTGYMAPGGGSHIVLSPKLIAKRSVSYKNRSVIDTYIYYVESLMADSGQKRLQSILRSLCTFLISINTVSHYIKEIRSLFLLQYYCLMGLN